MVFLAVYLFITSRTYFIETTVSNINALIAGVQVTQEVSPELLSKDFLEHLARLDDSIHYSLYNHKREVLAANFLTPKEMQVLVEGTVLIDLPGISYEGDSYKIAARVHTLENGQYLLLGRDISRSFGRQSTIELLIWGSMAALLVLIVLSFAISHVVVRRINQIVLTADRIINTGDLSQRVRVTSRWDDLSYLAQILNQLFQRVDELMQGVRQVSNSIAHDLRTPLTHMRNRIEALQCRKYGDSQEYEKGYAELARSADTLLATFNSLLRIASVENATLRQQFDRFPLHRVIGDVVELYTPLAEERGQQLEYECAQVEQFGDEHLVFQMLANLLDNAIKYSPDGSCVRIANNVQGGWSQITIADQGPGVETGLRGKVFERFFRIDPSRASGGGSGLGLSLVAAIAKLHRGDIELDDNHPGLVVRIHLPQAREMTNQA